MQAFSFRTVCARCDEEADVHDVGYRLIIAPARAPPPPRRRPVED
jgi:hypothetical protein